MKNQTKEKIRRLELLVRYRIRKMRHPGRVFLVSCAVILVVGFLGVLALCRHMEGRNTEAALKEKEDQYEALEKKYHSAKEQAKAQDEETRPWYLMLVNQSHPMEEGYVPELANIDDSHQVDARVLEPLQKMLQAAREEGYSLYVCSAYRSVDRQKELFNESMVDYVGQGMNYYEAAIETAKSIAWPGESEHATGLAMDIVSSEYAGLDEKQGETDDQKWLMEHCYEYGFILRYPQDKLEDTGIIYEPWHYRYVGVEAAMEIRDQGVTLEEYLNEEY